MAIPIVQATSVQDDTAVSSIVATWPGATTAGNTLVLFTTSGTATPLQVVPVLPAGWTLRQNVGPAGHTCTIATKVATGAETTVTISWTVTGVAANVTLATLAIAEIEGDYGGSASNGIVTSGSSQTLAGVTPGPGIEALLLAGVMANNAYGVTAYPFGYTLEEEQVPNVGFSHRASLLSMYEASTTSGAYTGTITYGGGMDNWASIHVYFVPGSGASILADFDASPRTGVPPLTVDFTDLSEGAAVTAWAWDFGDGSTSTSQNPTHVYAGIGSYTVVLVVTIDGDDYTVTKSLFVVVAAAYEDPLPGAALVEIYVAEAGAARWDVATWDDAVWSTAAWTDVTPESVTATILWGSNRPELGILSKPNAGSWSIDTYDPDRVLDPANADGPYYTDLLPGLPVRITHRGLVIRQGIAEAITHEFHDDSGIIRVQDNIAPLANASVPSDTALSNTLYARAIDAIAAAGLAVTVLPPPPSGDPAVADWVTGTSWTAWEWITDAAEQALHIAYIDRLGRLGFRAWASPLTRARTISAEELINLTSLTQWDGLFSQVAALDSVTDTVEVRALTPPPRYGVRTYERFDPTLDAGDWAAAVLADRSFSSVRWVPGQMYPLSAASVERLATIEAVELVGLLHSYTDPDVLATLIIVGGEIELTAKKDDEAKWWFTFEAAQVASAESLPLLTEDGLAFVVDETSGLDYVYPE